MEIPDHLRRQIEPLVMASEIQGLNDLHGYLKSENLVVQAQSPYAEIKQKQPAFLPRHWRIWNFCRHRRQPRRGQ